MKTFIRALKRRIGSRSPIRLGWHFAKAFFAALLNGFPARRLTVIGITGTDGKTTTVSMTAHILHAAGIPVGALSTAFMQVGPERAWNKTQKTSPSPFLVQGFLKKLRRAHCTHAVLEISSHGLVQGRVHHTNPSIAAITNLSAEHLDYHGTMDQYEQDKGKLFRMLRGKGTKVLNREDLTYASYHSIPSEHTVTYALHEGSNLWLSDVTVTETSSSALLHSSKSSETFPLHLSLTGGFNLENAICAISCAHAGGVSLDECVRSLESFTGTPGRMESIDEGQPFAVFVDFTVTPAAYEKTLLTLRQMLEPGKRILVLTGSCGDRMREKRPIVGRICSELADVVIVTNEDPYTEDPQKIIDDVWSGIDQSQCEAQQIFDRKDAMECLLKKARPGDAVILCAKGSDTTMWTAQGQIPWNERDIAREILRSL